MRKLISKIKETSMKNISRKYVSVLEPDISTKTNYFRLYFKILVIILKQIYSLDIHMLLVLHLVRVLSLPNIIISYFIFNFFNNIPPYSINQVSKRSKFSIIFAIIDYVRNWIYRLTSLLLAFNCLLKPKYIEILIIKHKKEVSLSNLSFFTLQTIIDNFIYLLKFSIILTHLTNPVSILRISYIRNQKQNLKFLLQSYLLIYIQDIFIFLIIILNSLFAFSTMDFFRELVFIYHRALLKLFTPEQKNLSLTIGVETCPMYIDIKNLTIRQFKTNLAFTFNFFLFFVNLPFFWKYKEIMYIYKFKFKLNERVFYDLMINFIDGILDILSPLIHFINIFIGDQNLISYFKSKYKLRAFSTRYNFFHINYLENKIYDSIFSILTFFRVACFTFYIFYIRWLFTDNKRNKIFPLMHDEKILKSLSNKNFSNFYTELNEIITLFNERRKKVFIILLTDFMENFYFILSFLTMINPLYIIIYVRTILLLYFKTIIRAENSHIKIVKKLKNIQITIFKNFIYDTFFFFPLFLLLCLISPWNFYFLLKHIYKYYIKTPLKEISKNFTLFKIREEIYSNTSYCKVLKIENQRFLSKMKEKIPKEWIFIFRFVTIHFSVFRAILFWKDLIFLYKYKKDRIKSVTKCYDFDEKPQTRNSTLLNFTSSIDFLHLDSQISNDVDEKNKKFKNKKQLLRRFSLKTLKFVNESNFKLLKLNLYRHYQHILNEILFYPLLIIITIITPWNIKKFSEIFKSHSFKDKYTYFTIIFKIFVSDIMTFFAVIFLLFSFVKTIDTIVLIYYSIKKNWIQQPEFKIYYDLEYKSNFKGQIKEMMKGLFSNFLIFCLILLNIILLTRIIYLAQRISYYLESKIKNDISKFKYLMKIHSSKSNNQIHPFLNEKTIPQITVFLNPQSVINFSCANSYFLSLLNMNIIWKNLFTNFYNKKLAQHNCIDFINPIVFENYKTLCRELTAYLSSGKKKRDQIIGVLQILMEETIESFLNIPHLILLPYKFLSLLLFKLRKMIDSKFKQIYTIGIFERNKNILLKLNHDKITEWIEFSNLDSFYFNIQLIGLMSLFDLILIKFEFFTNLIVLFHYRIITILSKNNSKILQCLDFIIFFNFHFILILFPFAISSGILKSSNHFQYLEQFYICYICSQSSSLEIMTKFTGVYGINIIIVLINLQYVSYMESILSQTNCKLYKIIKYVFNPHEMFVDVVSSIPSFLFNCVFPQILIRSYLIKKFASSFSIKNYLVIKISIIFLYICPFILNFVIKNSVLRLIVINTYGLFSLIILSINNY